MIALRLIRFKSYGDGTPQGLPPEYEAGLAVLRVRVFPATGESGSDADLRVDCTVGQPPEGAKEGIRLLVEALPNFNQEVSRVSLPRSRG